MGGSWGKSSRPTHRFSKWANLSEFMVDMGKSIVIYILGNDLACKCLIRLSGVHRLGLGKGSGKARKECFSDLAKTCIRTIWSLG